MVNSLRNNSCFPLINETENMTVTYYDLLTRVGHVDIAHNKSKEIIDRSIQWMQTL